MKQLPRSPRGFALISALAVLTLATSVVALFTEVAVLHVAGVLGLSAATR